VEDDMNSTKDKNRVHRLPITKARINLGQLVRRAHVDKEMFILEKDGIPVAVLMDINDLEDYVELNDPKLRKQIRKSNDEYLQGKGRPVEDFLSELSGESNKTRNKKK
jgi:prevent-host-death family protein